MAGANVCLELRRETRSLLCDESVMAQASKYERAPEFWLKHITAAKYPHLSVAIKNIFALPNSNAETERLFSLMKAVHTPVRNSLLLSTINNILSIKVNKSSPYTTIDFDQTVKRKCKVATAQYNKSHQSKA